MTYEIWLPLPMFADLADGYEVSNRGRVRRYGKMREGSPDPDGYLKVTVTRSKNEYSSIGVHRLVLMAFVGPCPEGMVTRHLDGDPSNNDLNNICWGTHEDNVEDRRRHGRMNAAKGVEHKSSLLTEEEVTTIRRMYLDGVHQRDLADLFDVSQGTISGIVRGKTYRDIRVLDNSNRPETRRGQRSLTEEQVQNIRRDRRAGATMTDLALQHSVSITTISRVVNKKGAFG